MKPVADLTTDELLAIALQFASMVSGFLPLLNIPSIGHAPEETWEGTRSVVGIVPNQASNLTTDDAVYVGWLTEPEFDSGEDFEDLVKRFPSKFTRLNPTRGSN